MKCDNCSIRLPQDTLWDDVWTSLYLCDKCVSKVKCDECDSTFIIPQNDLMKHLRGKKLMESHYCDKCSKRLCNRCIMDYYDGWAFCKKCLPKDMSCPKRSLKIKNEVREKRASLGGESHERNSLASLAQRGTSLPLEGLHHVERSPAWLRHVDLEKDILDEDTKIVHDIYLNQHKQ